MNPSQPDDEHNCLIGLRFFWDISGFNQLGQHTSSHGHRSYCYAKLDFSCLAMAVTTTSTQARREPQRGPGKHSCGAPKHFCWAPLGKFFLNFWFQNGAFWCIFMFLSDGGVPKRRGARSSLPPTPLSDDPAI